MQNLSAIGHLGADCEVKDLGSTQVINFSLAVTEKRKEESITTWYKCAYFTNSVAIAPYLTKGSLVGVNGTPSIETYQNSNGENISTLKCTVKDIKLYTSTKQ